MWLFAKIKANPRILRAENGKEEIIENDFADFLLLAKGWNLNDMMVCQMNT